MQWISDMNTYISDIFPKTHKRERRRKRKGGKKKEKKGRRIKKYLACFYSFDYQTFNFAQYVHTSKQIISQEGSEEEMSFWFSPKRWQGREEDPSVVVNSK